MVRLVVLDEGPPDGARRPLAGAMTIRPGRGPIRSGCPVAWLDGGAGMAVTTWGSSSNPTVPTDAEVDGQHLALSLTWRHPERTVVTADHAAYVTVVETPAGLDPRAPVVVAVGEREYRLPPAPRAGTS